MSGNEFAAAHRRHPLQLRQLPMCRSAWVKGCCSTLPSSARRSNPGAPGEAEILAFGSVRPWISPNFGTSWQSIPNNTLAGDQLNGNIKSLIFASATKLYAGTMAGGVYRFDKSGMAWTRTQLDTIGGASALPLAGVVTDIAVDRADGSGNSIYVTFGGSGDYRHVWHFNGAEWHQRSGPAAGDPNALLDVQHNAIVVDPIEPDPCLCRRRHRHLAFD